MVQMRNRADELGQTSFLRVPSRFWQEGLYQYVYWHLGSGNLSALFDPLVHVVYGLQAKAGDSLKKFTSCDWDASDIFGKLIPAIKSRNGCFKEQERKIADAKDKV